MLAPPVLDTQRLRLREITQQDCDDLFAICSDPEAMRYWNTPPWTTREQSANYIEEHCKRVESAITWGVCFRETDRSIGMATLHKIDRNNERAEIGYALLRESWGQGLISEALRAVMNFAFVELDLRRLEADTDPRNLPSCRTLERLGFVREGLLRERWVVAGEVSDTALYGLLRTDWVAG